MNYFIDMLNYLKISNLALMRSAEVEFAPGLNIITGETGAGKSILLGTVALLLGLRADKSLIRQGCPKCEISGEITFNPAAQPELNELVRKLDIEMENPNSIRLRRVITPSAGRCYINDTPVNLQTLAQIGAMLIDVHSANEHYSLMSHSRQLDIIDRSGDLENDADTVRNTFRALRQLKIDYANEMEHLPSPAEAELLNAMAADIEKISPKPAEDETVGAQFAIAANAREIIADCAEINNIISENENSISDMLAGVFRLLENINRMTNGRFEPLLDSCSNAADTVQEIAREVERFADNMELDEESLHKLEQRLSELQHLKRRYGPRLDDVLAKLDEAKAKLKIYNLADDRRKAFAEEEKTLSRELLEQAKILSGKRRKNAELFAKNVTGILHRLGMPDAKFEIRFNSREPGERGIDEVEFFFSANKGIDVQPIRQMASSGELSRVMLAIKAALAQNDPVPVLIFDEIDVNIGGETAFEVAKTLRELAGKRQILCISHLPQVAAYGSHHFAVQKHDGDDGMTVSEIRELDFEGRIEELTRMLGGGTAAEKHAEELLNSSKEVQK